MPDTSYSGRVVIDEGELPRIVTFRIGQDLFAAPIERVERVLRYETPRRVPGSPPWVEGVVEYHDRVVPVVNIALRYGLTGCDPSAPTRVLILSSPEEWMAIVVDAVLDVRPLKDGALERAPSALRGAGLDAMRGIVHRGGDLVIVLDIDRLMASASERAQLDDARGSVALG